MVGLAFSNALADFTRFRRVAAWVFVVLAMFGIGKLLLMVNPDQKPGEAYVMLSAILVFRLLALAAAIFSTAVITQEVENRTIVYLLTRPIPRWQLLLGRTLAAVLVVFVLSVFASVAVSLAAYNSPWNSQMARDLPALAIGACAYTAVFVLLSLFINRAMIVCLLFAFGWEPSVTNMPGDIYRLSINSYLTAIAERPSNSGQKSILDVLGGLLGVNTIPTGTAWAVIVLMTTLAMGVAAWWFTHFEYVPREDGE